MPILDRDMGNRGGRGLGYGVHRTRIHFLHRKLAQAWARRRSLGSGLLRRGLLRRGCRLPHHRRGDHADLRHARDGKIVHRLRRHRDRPARPDEKHPGRYGTGRDSGAQRSPDPDPPHDPRRYHPPTTAANREGLNPRRSHHPRDETVAPAHRCIDAGRRVDRALFGWHRDFGKSRRRRGFPLTKAPPRRRLPCNLPLRIEDLTWAA